MLSNITKRRSYQLVVLAPRAAVGINMAASLLMLLTVTLLFHPVFDWAWQQVARPDGQYHLIVSAGFIALCGFRLFREKRTLTFADSNSHATLLLCIVCIAYLLNQHYVQFNAISVALFLLFCFALLGHFVSTQTWRSCLLPLFLALLVLPFEGYLDIFLGFPMRLLSAEAAVSALQAFGVTSISSDTVLLIDNRAAIVDIDCSGIRGFWIGSVFFFAITWIERYRMNLKWLLIAIIAAALLFLGNVFRIVALVILDLVLNMSKVAQLVHESLGLFSFALVMLLSWQMLRLYADRHSMAKPQALIMTYAEPIADELGCIKSGGCNSIAAESTSAESKNRFPSVSITTVYLTLLIFSFSLFQTNDRSPSSSIIQTSPLDFNELHFNEATLNDVEKKFFSDNGAQAYKFSSSIDFDENTYQASILVVVSGQWKAQHIPEQCYVAQGYRIVSSRMLSIGGEGAGDTTTKDSIVSDLSNTDSVSFRQLDLVRNSGQDDGGNSVQHEQSYTSDYWFQSSNQSTVNYARRVFSQILHPDIPWAMVSVLWHEGVPDKARQQLLLDLQDTVKRKMNNHG